MQKTKVVVGLGKTGLACVRYLTNCGFHVAVTDSREHPPGLAELRKNFPGLPVALGHFDKDLIEQADELILSPGVALNEPLIAKAQGMGKTIIGDIEVFARDNKSPVVAITGSNGKSTVTSLVGEMAHAAGLDARVGGNIGTPVLDLISDKPADLFVLELSSFQLETTYQLNSAAAVILNLSPDHLDRYNSIVDYLQAKQRIYTGCQQAVINRDQLDIYQNLNLQNTISFGLSKPGDNEFGLVDDSLYFGAEKLVTTADIKLKGRHQVANILAAFALGHAVQLPLDVMINAVKNFRGLAHRCQWVTRNNGVDWYNDSKATNIGSAKAAIEGLGADANDKLILIAGGIGKNADFSVLKNTIEKYVKHVVLYGRDAKLIAEAWDGLVEIEFAKDLAVAVQQANAVASDGDTVLFAPGCASFDMFRNFEHRGDVFIAEVKAL